jgi:probable rRNA maturation factor
MLASVVNLQRAVQIDPRDFQDLVEALQSGIPEANKKHVTVAFISDRRMMELNKFFRGADATTDVLSFPSVAEDFEKENSDQLGDVVISLEQAQRQAQAAGLTLDAEVRQLILHGVLHLCGYDHETDSGEMNARELELRDKFGI